ncbi:hypothetical protein [Hymenobacter roseosalivarius]|uniref:hypothetical protein n=1 Tax=Hymenobacter roseosalivarius TaxID=89967 RepID=UPI000A00A128|nr:hypothetical protein [Hymenobacter roseosalivarius]
MIAQKINGGYSYTLATYALEFLHKAEHLFGSKTNHYTFGGVEVAANATPMVWYPVIGGHQYIMAQVTPDALEDNREAMFQLSHEMVHVLSPNGKPFTNNIEEGLAAWFSIRMTEEFAHDRSYAEQSVATSAYSYPCQLVTNLLLIEPDAIRRLRMVQPVLGLVTAADFVAAGLTAVPHCLIEELVKPMNYTLIN